MKWYWWTCYMMLFITHDIFSYKISSDTPKDKAQLMHNEMTQRESDINPHNLHIYYEKRAKFNKRHAKIMNAEQPLAIKRRRKKNKNPVDHNKELKKMEELLKETESLIK